MLGVLDVQSAQRAAFGSDDVRIQSSLASQVAVALESARYLDDLRQQGAGAVAAAGNRDAPISGHVMARPARK